MREYVYPSPVIANRIQEVFDEFNLNDGFVASQIGCERKTIGAYRRAETNPSIKFVRWICSTYHKSPVWLLDLGGYYHAESWRHD